MLSALPDEILDFCTQQVGQLKQFKPASGGCINQGGALITEAGKVFIKWNSNSKFPGMFEAEAAGLHRLHSAGCIRVPQVFATLSGELYGGVLLEYIESGVRSKNFWADFGAQLAELHKISNDRFGLDHDNYMGSLPQTNEPSENWIEFYTESRLRLQVQLAYQNGKIDLKGREAFEKFYVKLPALLENGSPSLVHGDLWNGNFIIGPSGEPVLIDPAISYSHREVDLAMTRLFGGFDSAFYESYQDYFPLTAGFEERLDIYQLYPLLVHVNLFGGSYYRQVLSIIRRYV